MISYKIYLIFIPLFLIFYGTNTYGLHAISLFDNPFAEIKTEQWIQESPIQYFIGYPINLLINDPALTHWLVVAIGFAYLMVSLFLYDYKYKLETQIIKILYFTPFFLILFTWMGKPDTFTIGSLFFLIIYNNSVFLSFLFTLILIFSHPQIAIIYFVLIKYLKIFNLKLNHYLSIFIVFVTYYFYLNLLKDFDGRYEVISQEIDRVFKTMFTNTLSGLISLFMWLWVVIFFSKYIKEKKFLTSLVLIFSISFFTLDHTRIFMQLSVPLIIYLSTKKDFVDSFKYLLDRRIMYVIGFFQLQKRGDGRIVDGINLYENKYVYSFIQRMISIIENIINTF